MARSAEAARSGGRPALILVDTSVWIRKWAAREPFASALDALLRPRQVAAHALIYGELMMGSAPGHNRDRLLGALTIVPWLVPVPHEQVVTLVRERHLAGRGLGWIDAHLLAAAISAQCPLWTADEALARAAEEARIGWKP